MKQKYHNEKQKKVKRKHPDFDDVRNSDDFHGWAKEQPKSIQDWIYKNADDADLPLSGDSREIWSKGGRLKQSCRDNCWFNF